MAGERAGAGELHRTDGGDRDEAVLDVDDLPAETFPAPGVASSGRPAAEPPSPLALAGVSLKDIEERAIRDTLDATGGSRTEAARLLGISLATLHRRIEEYGIARLRKPNE